MSDETSGMMDIASMRGQAVYMARVMIGGVWWNIGIFGNKEDAEKSIVDSWNTPDVQKSKVDEMVVR